MASLQGFQQVSLTAPLSKAVMTVTDSVIRLNKAAAAELHYPPYVHVLINESTKQIAIQGCATKDEDAVKFSKPAEKQTTSISIKAPAMVAAVTGFFELSNPAEDEIDYRSIPASAQSDNTALIFAVADAKAGTMKKRGRKKTADAE